MTQSINVSLPFLLQQYLGAGLEDEILPTPSDEGHYSHSVEEVSAAVQLGDLNNLNNQPMHPDVKTMDLCVEKGPVMASYFDFSLNQGKRHFLTDFYVKMMPGSERICRDWPV